MFKRGGFADTGIMEGFLTVVTQLEEEQILALEN